MQPCSFQNRCGSEQAWRFACSGAQPCFKSPRGCSCQAGSGACHFTDTKGAEKWHGHICSVLPLVFTGSSDGENVRKVTTESKLLTDLYGTDTRELSAFRGWCYSKARSWDLLAKGWLAPSCSCQMQREANPSSDLRLCWVLGTGCSSSSHMQDCHVVLGSYTTMNFPTALSCCSREKFQVVAPGNLARVIFIKFCEAGRLISVGI